MVRTIANAEDGTHAEIARNKSTGQYPVILRDTDSGEVVGAVSETSAVQPEPETEKPTQSGAQVQTAQAMAKPNGLTPELELPSVAPKLLQQFQSGSTENTTRKVDQWLAENRAGFEGYDEANDKWVKPEEYDAEYRDQQAFLLKNGKYAVVVRDPKNDTQAVIFEVSASDVKPIDNDPPARLGVFQEPDYKAHNAHQQAEEAFWRKTLGQAARKPAATVDRAERETKFRSQAEAAQAYKPKAAAGEPVAEVKAESAEPEVEYGPTKPRYPKQLKPGDRVFMAEYAYVTVESVPPFDRNYPKDQVVEMDSGPWHHRPDEVEAESPIDITTAPEPSAQKLRHAKYRPTHSAEPEQPRNIRNFRIQDSQVEDIGAGGDKTKIHLNLDAIKVLRTIEKEQRPATPSEQAQLARYVDFGGLRKLWDQPWNFRAERDRLESLLTGEEIDAIKETSLNTHYTSLPVVDGIWAGVRKLGFTGGRILEPGIGVGNFFGRIPEDISSKSSLMGVEKNIVSGRMARILYPDAKISVKPYEEVQMPNDSMDLIIGNPPFADIKIYDTDYKRPKLALHNYFIVKSLDKLSPGGIAALITSHYTLDAMSTRAREEMAKRADLIAAIRLPDDAFKKTAGTEVTTDILFFRKRIPGEELSRFHQPWANTVAMPITNSSGTVQVNEYFQSHPEMVIGTHSLEGSMYAADQYAVKSTGGDLAEQLFAAIQRLPQGVAHRHDPSSALADPTLTSKTLDIAPDNIKENAFFLEDDKVWIKQKGVREPLPPDLDKPSIISQLKSVIALRDALKNTLRLQMENPDDAELHRAQELLAGQYTSYRAQYGPLTAAKTARVFRDDPEYSLLTAIENVDPETQQVTCADIFTKRLYSRIYG